MEDMDRTIPLPHPENTPADTNFILRSTVFPWRDMLRNQHTASCSPPALPRPFTPRPPRESRVCAGPTSTKQILEQKPSPTPTDDDAREGQIQTDKTEKDSDSVHNTLLHR